jgi:hypothetical protein
MVVHAYNLMTKEAEARGLWVWGQPVYTVGRAYSKKKSKQKQKTYI